MTDIVEKASALLAGTSGRRRFLAKAALAGSAVVAAPRRFALEPLSAYAAVCTCSGSSCDCGAACCDGYTEFCCTITGRNSCPPGTALGGWWKADGSGYCGGPRYYLDCNTTPGNEWVCSCGCAGGNCNNRKSCCTNFRYGQCHQEIPNMGAIHCRVVTCTPPWQLDATCTTTLRTDQATASHDAPCLHEEDDMPPAPSVVLDTQGRRWVFARGTDMALWSKLDDNPWERRGGILTSGPGATAGPNGRIDVVARGGNGSAYIISFENGVWGDWRPLGGIIG